MTQPNTLSHYHTIYLSPHLDDVALSCGGQIVQQTEAKERVLIVTVTAGNAPSPQTLSAFAKQQHQSMQLGDNPVAQRRDEDKMACAILGADYLHWDIQDCIYRRVAQNGVSFPLYQTEAAIFGLLHSTEINLLDDLLAQLPDHDLLVAPLAIGNHVDHQLVREAAEKQEAVAWYPDYPYTQRNGNILPKEIDEEQFVTVRLSAEAIALKIAAISAYQSQVPHLFGSYTKMAQMVMLDAAVNDGERILKRTARRDSIHRQQIQ